MNTTLQKNWIVFSDCGGVKYDLSNKSYSLQKRKLLKRNQVSKINARAKADACVLQQKISTGFSCMFVIAN